MKQIKKLFILVLVATFATACSLVGVSEWNANKVTVEVRDTSNELIDEAVVTSTADEINKSKTPGTYSLLYAKTGLQVVTVSAPHKQTKQIKVSVPADNNKIFTVILNDQ